MKRKQLILILAAALLWPNRPVFATNIITDVRDNLVWTIGQKAEVGEAIKLAGAGDLSAGETATSMLAGVFDYRFLSFSYGGTRVNKNDANFTDTAKLGFRLTSFFGWFKNPPTSSMEWMRNLNVGPSFAIPLFSAPHSGTLFLDINFAFGAPPAVPAP